MSLRRPRRGGRRSARRGRERGCGVSAGGRLASAPGLCSASVAPLALRLRELERRGLRAGRVRSSGSGGWGGGRGAQAGGAESDESSAPPPPPAGPALCLPLRRPDDLSREGSESRGPGPSPAPPLLRPGPAAVAGPRARPPSPPPPRPTEGPARPRLLRT